MILLKFVYFLLITYDFFLLFNYVFVTQDYSLVDIIDVVIRRFAIFIFIFVTIAIVLISII